MPKHLAITIAGAVSLGSYEAGVLWEVVDAIRQHNQTAATADDKIVIDVLTGASAGGMTAIILAQKLLYNFHEFAGPYDNPLYNTWVKRISLAGLQNTGIDEPAIQSIFSSNLIEAISREAVTGRYDGVPAPPDPHPAVGDGLRVGVALTNLNGIPYGYAVQPDQRFTYLDYSDQFTRPVNGDCDQREFWEPLRQAAVACGAFPFAFRVQGIERSQKNDPDDFTGNLQWDGTPATFTYSDGGILQNQPLGLAKNLVDQIDCHLRENRFYLFVSPHAKDPSPAQIDASKLNMFEGLKRIVALVMGQSGFHDWITAHEINERVRLLDQRAAELAAHMKDGRIDVKSLAITSESVLSLFFPAGTQNNPGATEEETRQAARTRISKQYATEGVASGAPEVFCDAVLAFESAAQLGARDLMIIYGITANPDDLAGAQLQSFLGFFDQQYRDHDYDIGRRNGQAFLAGQELNTPGQLGPLRYVPAEIRSIDEGLNGLRVHQVPKDVVQPFRKGIEQRVEQMVKELHPGWPLASQASKLVVDLVIRHIMPGAEPDPAKPLGNI